MAFKILEKNLVIHVESGLKVMIFANTNNWSLINAMDESVVAYFNGNVFMLSKIIREAFDYSREIAITQELIELGIWRHL